MSLVPAKQFAPVVVLKAGLVRFPMLSPPSDSTYWGHLRKNVPGQCRKRAEFVGHFWWEIPGSESILGFLTTSEEDSDSKLGKIRAMACGSDTVGCRPWGDLGSLRESYCNWHKKPKPEKVTKVIDGYLWIFMEFYGYLWIFIWILMVIYMFWSCEDLVLEIASVLPSSARNRFRLKVGHDGSDVLWRNIGFDRGKGSILGSIMINLPSGKRLRNYGKIHHAIHGQTIYNGPFSIALFLWAMASIAFC